MSDIQPSQHSLRILMLPWLAHGHISPFLELAKQLSTNPTTTISIYLCSTPINLKSLSLSSTSFPNIHLTKLHLNTNHLPSHLHTTRNLPSHLMPLLKTAFDESSPSFSALLSSLSPHLLLYDFLMPWAPSAASRLRIPAVLFLPIASSAAALFSHLLLLPPHHPFPFMPNLDPRQLKSMLESDGHKFLQCITRSTNIIAVRTFKEIESQYIHHLSTLVGKEIVPVGPILSADEYSNNGGYELEWLSGKEKGSVVYVSVGSEYFMKEEEMEELAIGLELCGLWSIWVVRFEGGGGLGKGFAWERGLVVEGWAPQKAILGHASVGGFVTHCGWSSVIEGMRRGLGIVAMPLQLDQFSNAELMVEIGVAIRAEREEGSGVYRGEEVARCVREVMVGEKGEGMRRRGEEVGRVVGCKGGEEIEVFRKRIEELVRVDGNDDGNK